MSELDTLAMPKLAHYAVWYGPLYNDIYDCPVESRDPNTFELDERADIFRIYDRLELDWEHEGSSIHLRSEEFNFSPYYVPGGHLCDQDERHQLWSPTGWLIGYQPPDNWIALRTRFNRPVPLSRPCDIVFLPDSK